MMNWQPLINLLSEAVDTVAPAMVCRVEQGGELRFEEAVGWLDPETQNRPTEVDTLFDYASLTKLFTTTACLRLIDAGLLALDMPLVDIFPEFGELKLLGGAEDPITKQPTPVDPRWLTESGSSTGGLSVGPMWFDTSQVTIRSLLTHTSGLPAWRSVYRICGSVPPSSQIMRRVEQSSRAQAALGALMAYPFIYPPGESYAYSDIGLMLLGAAIVRQHSNGADGPSRHLGKSISSLVSKPLGLSATYLPDERLQDAIAPTELCQWRNRRLVGEVHDENAAGIGGIAGHAGMFGSARDLCRLGQLYLNRGEALLSAGIVDEAITEQVCTAQFCTEAQVRRGLGWMLRSEPNPSCSRKFSAQSFGHTGYTGTSLWCDPERDLTVVLLTNRVYYGREPQRIAQFRPAVHETISLILSGKV